MIVCSSPFKLTCTLLTLIRHFLITQNAKKSNKKRRHKHDSSSSSSSSSSSDESTPPRKRRKSKSKRRKNKKKKRSSRKRSRSSSSRSSSPSPGRSPARIQEGKNDDSKISAAAELVNGRNLSHSFMTPASNLIQNTPHAEADNFVTQMSQMNDNDNVNPGMYVSTGSITTMFGMNGANDTPDFQPTVQVVHLKEISSVQEKRWKVAISDGTHFFTGMVGSQLNPMVDNGEIKQHAIIKVIDFLVHTNKGQKFFILLKAEFMHHHSCRIGTPAAVAN